MTPRSHQHQVFAQSQRISETVFLVNHAFAFWALDFLLRQGSSLMSRLIGEPLALHSLEQNVRAVGIFNPKSNAIAIAEIEFGKIAVQVVVAAMLIDTFHTAFEDREEALDGVGMHGPIFARNVLAKHMTGEAVIREMQAQIFVLSRIISHYARARVDVRLQDGKQGAHLQVIDHDATRFPGAAVDQGQDFVLVLVPASPLVALGLLGEVASDESFIDFHVAALAAERFNPAILHRFPDSVRHEPRGLQGNPKGAVQLVRANALLAGSDQKDSLEPQAQRDVAGLKNGADLDGKGLAAVIALVSAYAGTLTAHLAVALHPAPVRAYRAARPDTGFYESVGAFPIVKMGA